MISYVVQEHTVGGEDDDWNGSKVIAVFSSEAEARSFVLMNENLRDWPEECSTNCHDSGCDLCEACELDWHMLCNTVEKLDVTRFEGASSQTVASWLVQE